MERNAISLIYFLFQCGLITNLFWIAKSKKMLFTEYVILNWCIVSNFVIFSFIPLHQIFRNTDITNHTHFVLEDNLYYIQSLNIHLCKYIMDVWEFQFIAGGL